MARNIDKLLTDAEKAYQKRDRREVAKRVDKILKQDFTHQATWEFLYKIYGGERTFEDFQRAFTEKYYPDKLDLLEASDRGATDLTGVPSDVGVESLVDGATVREELGADTKRPSLIARIINALRRPFRRGDKEEPDIPADTDEPTTAESAITRPRGARPGDQDVSRRIPERSLLKSAPPRAAGQSPGLGDSQRGTVSSLPQGVPSARDKAGRPPLPPSRSPGVPTSVGGPLFSAVPESRGVIRVMVVDDIAQTRENVIRSLRFVDEIEVVGVATNGVRAIELAKEVQPDVIVMDVNMPDMDGITATSRIRREVPFSQIVILTVQDDVDYIRQAMMAGARDFLAKPPTIDELVLAVRRANEYTIQAKADAEEFLEAQLPRRLVSPGKVITVYSPRGGTGCTMLSTNLASVLHNEETRVIVVDGNLQFGDVPVMFNVQGRNTILDLASRSDQLDRGLIEEVAIAHASGIKLIAPPTPDQADNITGAQFTALLGQLRTQFPYVIVDTAHRLTTVTLAAFDASDIVILIVTQDIPSIARARRFLDLVPLLGLDQQRFLVVINQYDKRIGITPGQIGQTLQREVVAAIPVEKGVVIPSINRGIPFMLREDAVSRPVARAVLEMVKAIRHRITKLEEAAIAAEEEKEKD